MKAILKMFILKQIANEPSTGYQIMKACYEKLGYKPSAGSIYPLLKSMEKEGIISSKREGRRVIYSLSNKGRKFFDGIEKIRDEFYKKLHSHIAATAEIFDDKELKSIANFFKNEKFKKVIFMIGSIDERKVDKILDELYRRLKNESNRNKRANKRI